MTRKSIHWVPWQKEKKERIIWTDGGSYKKKGPASNPCEPQAQPSPFRHPITVPTSDQTKWGTATRGSGHSHRRYLFQQIWAFLQIKKENSSDISIQWVAHLLNGQRQHDRLWAHKGLSMTGSPLLNDLNSPSGGPPHWWPIESSEAKHTNPINPPVGPGYAIKIRPR